MVSAEPTVVHRHLFRVLDYDLATTLDSGQAFRWKRQGAAWTAVIDHRWVRLTQTDPGILAEIATDAADWRWLETYLQTQLEMDCILKQLPDDPMLMQAIRKHRGLRLLRQDPWECLASFILSSTKQITHIKQIVERLCAQHGDPVVIPTAEPTAYAFPAADRIASLDESKLRALKMGFRAPYLLEAARRVSAGRLDLERLKHCPLHEARTALMDLPGVGRKIADCVLLFSLGFDQAFPVDVWVMRALQTVWFPNRQPTPRELVEFAETNFGPRGGYAQQYLFHHARTEARSANPHSTPGITSS